MKLLPIILLVFIKTALCQDVNIDSWLSGAYLKLNYIDDIASLIPTKKAIDVKIELRYFYLDRKLIFILSIKDNDNNIYGLNMLPIEDYDNFFRRIWFYSQQVPIYRNGYKDDISSKEISSIGFVLIKNTTHVQTLKEIENYNRQPKTEVTYSIDSTGSTLHRIGINHDVLYGN